MPARVIIVHTDRSLIDLAPSLRVDGYEVAAFIDPIAAWDALASARRIEALITGIEFGPTLPHGLALARAARMKIPGFRVLFIGAPDLQALTDGYGMFLSLPVTISEVTAAVVRMLGTARDVWDYTPGEKTARQTR